MKKLFITIGMTALLVTPNLVNADPNNPNDPSNPNNQNLLTSCRNAQQISQVLPKPIATVLNAPYRTPCQQYGIILP